MSRRPSVVSSRIRQRGMTLIELMIALLLGLLVTGAAIGIFISNKRAYTATESIGRVQENGRVAYELMAREIRESAGNPCSANIPMANVLNSTPNWWAQWGSGITGYSGSMATSGLAFGTAAAERVSGTDAIELRGAESTGVSVVDHNPNSAQFKTSTNNHGLSDGDIVVVCDFKQAAIFQVSNAQNGINNTVVHNTGNSVQPGNCSHGLGYANPMNCSTTGTSYAYGKNSVLVKLRASRWYIGNNSKGGRSLYQSTLQNSGGTLTTQNSEIIDGVTGMTITYMLENATSYATATAALDWSKVDAVKVDIALEDQARVGTSGEKVARRIAHIVTLRNRVQ